MLRTALIASTLLAPASMAASVPDRADDVRPLSVGAAAPEFTVRRPDGSDYRFEPAERSAPALLIFYRGGWCPYCNAHLAELRRVVPRLRSSGYDVLFLSADQPALLHSSLEDDMPEYTLLSDSRMQAARAFGVAFRVDDETYERYRGLGLDLEAASGETHHELPVPAVFLVDASGTVRYVHADPDYTVRLSAEELEGVLERTGIAGAD